MLCLVKIINKQSMWFIFYFKRIIVYIYIYIYRYICIYIEKNDLNIEKHYYVL